MCYSLFIIDSAANCGLFFFLFLQLEADTIVGENKHCLQLFVEFAYVCVFIWFRLIDLFLRSLCPIGFLQTWTLCFQVSQWFTLSPTPSRLSGTHPEMIYPPSTLIASTTLLAYWECSWWIFHFEPWAGLKRHRLRVWMGLPRSCQS